MTRTPRPGVPPDASAPAPDVRPPDVRPPEAPDPGMPPDAPAPDAPVRVTARCAGCGACLLTCPAHAIRPRGGALLVRGDLCTGCGECVEVCPVDAIEETGPLIPTPYGGVR